MDRISHVKIVSPDPAAVDRFLREVLDVPQGWALGSPEPVVAPTPEVRSGGRDAEGNFTAESVGAFRGASSLAGGFITGTIESRQFQILSGPEPRLWAVAVGTRHLERAHARCVERGIPCTDPTVSSWGDGKIRFFFAEAGGIVFEIMRIESE